MSRPKESEAPALTAGDARATSDDQRFVQWMEAKALTFVVTLRPGSIMTVTAQDGALRTARFPMDPPLGVAARGSTLAIATRTRINLYAGSRRLAPHLPRGRSRHDRLVHDQGPYDTVFVPVSTFHTGECMAHDLVLDGPSVVFANTRFSCLARADGVNSFADLWRPPFISKVLPQDRCHLNSFASDGGRIRYATAFGASDEPDGHRGMPVDSGVVIDVEANAVVVSGLMKPHSARIFGGELYVLNSAAGQLLAIDLEARGWRCLASLPGFTRGLRSRHGVLLVGLSKMRATARSLGFPLMERADSLFAGIVAVDPASGETLGTIRFSPEIEEVLDLEVLDGVGHAAVLDPSGATGLSGIETPRASYWTGSGQEPHPDVAERHPWPGRDERDA